MFNQRILLSFSASSSRKATSFFSSFVSLYAVYVIGTKWYYSNLFTDQLPLGERSRGWSHRVEVMDGSLATGNIWSG